MAAASLLRVGETEAGLRSLRSVVAAWPEHPLPRYRLAVVLAGSGRGPEALDALAGAVTAGLAAPDELEAEPAFDRLHGDPRFHAAVSGARRNQAGGGSGGGAGP
jgi:thioredoxin-like negative regulator of GroEL